MALASLPLLAFSVGAEAMSFGARVAMMASASLSSVPARPARARAVSLALLTLSVLAAPNGATARELWSQPALGPSASGDPEVLFTFDDGPHQIWTRRVLALLRRHHVQAIFFMAGWRLKGVGDAGDARRTVAAEIIAHGHAVGNHTLSHAHLCVLPATQGEQEIDGNAELLRRFTGDLPFFFRTPYGSRCQRLEKMLADRGLNHLHWDLDPQEYLAPDPEEVRKYFVGRLSRLDGRAVILLHDTHGSSVRALEAILDWITEENERRRTTGRRPIRILSWADVVREKVASGLLPALAAAEMRVRRAPGQTLRRLLGPLAGLGAPAISRRTDPEPAPAPRRASVAPGL